jgi:flagellar biogenesis protein FliO
MLRAVRSREVIPVDERQALSGHERWSQTISQLLVTLRNALRKVKVRRRERALQLCETLPLGERRFLIVVRFEGRRFLIGATNQSISLIERLDERGHPLPEPQERRWNDSLWKRPH